MSPLEDRMYCALRNRRPVCPHGEALGVITEEWAAEVCAEVAAAENAALRDELAAAHKHAADLTEAHEAEVARLKSELDACQDAAKCQQAKLEAWLIKHGAPSADGSATDCAVAWIEQLKGERDKARETLARARNDLLDATVTYYGPLLTAIQEAIAGTGGEIETLPADDEAFAKILLEVEANEDLARLGFPQPNWRTADKDTKDSYRKFARDVRVAIRQSRHVVTLQAALAPAPQEPDHA